MRDLQCSALINDGLYQLGREVWCADIRAVTHSRTHWRVAPLYTEHKDHKQVLATSALPSVNSWAFKVNHGSPFQMISTQSQERLKVFE